MAVNAQSVALLLSRMRSRGYSNELELQNAVEDHLRAAGVEFVREFQTGAGPVDFMVGDVAIEVKIKHSLSDLTRQVYRYLAQPSVGSLVVLTTKARLTQLPAMMHGKELVTVHLIGAAL